MKKIYYDYKKMKSDISLPEFLRDELGWIFQKDSTYKKPKFKNPSGDIQIQVGVNQYGYYTCWDVQRGFIKGEGDKDEFGNKILLAGSTIFDIVQLEVQRRTGVLIDVYEAAKIIDEYVKQGHTILPQNSVFNIEKELVTSSSKQITSQILPLNTEYLESRGIKPELLKTKEWEGVFFTAKTYIPQTQKYIFNTATYLNNREGIVGISKKGYGFAGAEGIRVDSIAQNRFDRSRSKDKIHLFESIIDAVSYYQMNYYPNKGDFNVQMLSTEGALTSAQINTVQEIINRDRVSAIEINFDNDIAGLIYALNIAGNITLPDQINKNLDYLEVSRSSHDETPVICIDISLRAANKNEAKSISDKYFNTQILNKYIDRSDWKVQVMNKNENFVYRLIIPALKEIVRDLTLNIIDIRFDKQVELVLPKEKDFNQDLVNSQNKHINNDLNIEI